MKVEIIHLMVRVAVQTTHRHISDTVHELETESEITIKDTANINVLDTEILLSRISNPNKRN